MLASAILAATIMVTIPSGAVPDLNIACDRLIQKYRAKADTTNAECAAMLIRIGLTTMVMEETKKTARHTKNVTLDVKRVQMKKDFPRPLRPRVCGDGELDQDEQCDDGALNSDSIPDSCRTDCVPPSCGDGVIDTEEVCDGDGCAEDCSGQL